MQTNLNNASTFLTNKTSTLINHTNLLQNKNHLLLKNILQLIHKNNFLLHKTKTIKNLTYSINLLSSLSPSPHDDIIKYILTHYIQVLSNAEGIALSHKECKYKIKQLIYEHILTFPYDPHYEICNEIQLFYSANKRIQHCASCSAIKNFNNSKMAIKKREGSLSYNKMLKCKTKQSFGYADAYGKNSNRNENTGICSRTLNVEKDSSIERKNLLFKTTVGRRGRTRKNNCVLCNSNTLFSNSNINNNNNNNISNLESGCNNIPPIPIIASEYDYVTPKSTYDDTMNLLSTIKKYA